MGTTKRKSAKPSKRALKSMTENEQRALETVTSVREAVRTLNDAAERLESRSAYYELMDENGRVMDESVEVTQEDLESVYEAQAALKSLAGEIERFESAMMHVRKSGGVFTTGRYVISFPETVRTSVSWKGEAEVLAAKLAEAEGREFDLKAYAESVKASATSSKSTKVKISKGE